MNANRLLAALPVTVPQQLRHELIPVPLAEIDVL
jgi:hypothetical protein